MNTNNQFCTVCGASTVNENFEIRLSEIEALHVVEQRCIVCGIMAHKEMI